MTSSVKIRRAQIGDVPTLGDLGAMLVAEHYQFDHERFLAPRPDMPRSYGEFLASQLERPDAIVLVAEVDGTVAGYVFAGNEGDDYMTLRGPAGVIYDLVVDPGRRGRGVGAALLEAMFAALKELGAPRVLLFTAEKNEAAQRLFERHGFRRTMIEMTRELP